jgi:pyruvate ferredoxin oxidoreductase gamma subunit/2-oxoisovalerate ferredoxin oxidoreductase gamma subunit
MKEITFFGRGGQGAVVASELLADAYFREGYQVQCFPSFGVERRGAPVTAFLRIDTEFIYLRSMIYKAHIGLVFSEDIVHGPTFKPSLRNDAKVLINSAQQTSGLDGFGVHYVDASAIALKCGLGSPAQPLVNTAMLGAFAKIAGDLALENLLQAVESKVPKNVESNLRAVRQAYDSVISGE